MNCTRCGRVYKPLRRELCKSCYQTTLERQTAYGRWESTFVDAEPARQHVLALIAAGVSRRQIVKLAGIPRSSLGTLLTGKRVGPAEKIWESTANRLLAVEIPGAVHQVAAAGDHMPAVGAIRRLQSLVAAGWPMSTLSRECGMGEAGVSGLLRTRPELITVDKHRRVVEVFARLQLEPGPSLRARNLGRQKRWPLPFQWDEADLDVPDARVAVYRRAKRRVKAAA